MWIRWIRIRSRIRIRNTDMYIQLDLSQQSVTVDNAALVRISEIKYLFFIFGE
jgi:hypothetical protein